jgi:hypothetical protein
MEEQCLNTLKHRVLWNHVWASEGGKNKKLEEEIMRRFMMYTHCHTWSSWLKHCAASRKVAVSMAHGVIGIFHSLSPFGRTMALGSTQPVTDMITRDISWG